MRALRRRRASRSSGASAWLVPWLVLGLLLARSSEASEARAAEGEIEPIDFEYAAPRDCPSTEQVLRQIAVYTTKWALARPGEGARRFVLGIARRDEAYVGRFDLREKAGNTVGRDVTGDSCEDVALGLAIAVALAIDPQAALGAEAKAVDRPDAFAPSTPALPVDGEKTPAPKKPLSRRRVPPRVFVAIGTRAEANSAVSGLLAVIDAYLELEVAGALEQLPWFRPVLRAGFRQSFTRTTRVGQTQADIGWSAGQVEVCPSRFVFASHLSVEACFGSNLGVLSAQARGIPDAGTTRRFWFDYGALLAARWQFHPSLFAETVGAMWVPQKRDRLRVEPDGVVTEAPAVGFSAGMGIGWRF